MLGSIHRSHNAPNIGTPLLTSSAQKTQGGNTRIVRFLAKVLCCPIISWRPYTHITLKYRLLGAGAIGDTGALPLHRPGGDSSDKDGRRADSLPGGRIRRSRICHVGKQFTPKNFVPGLKNVK